MNTFNLTRDKNDINYIIQNVNDENIVYAVTYNYKLLQIHLNDFEKMLHDNIIERDPTNRSQGNYVFKLN